MSKRESATGAQGWFFLLNMEQMEWVLIVLVLELFSRGQRAGNPELSLVWKAHSAMISRMKSACPWVPYPKMALHRSGWLELKDMMLKTKHTSVSGGFRAIYK